MEDEFEKPMDINDEEYEDVTDECEVELCDNGYVRMSHDGVGIMSWGVGAHYTHKEGMMAGYLVVLTDKVVPRYSNFKVLKHKDFIMVPVFYRVYL